FNPYCGGSDAGRIRVLQHKICMDPFQSLLWWIRRWKLYWIAWHKWKRIVSILIVVDQTLEDWVVILFLMGLLCFNPYCGGSDAGSKYRFDISITFNRFQSLLWWIRRWKRKMKVVITM